MSFEKPLFKFP